MQYNHLEYVKSTSIYVVLPLNSSEEKISGFVVIHNIDWIRIRLYIRHRLFHLLVVWQLSDNTDHTVGSVGNFRLQCPTGRNAAL